MVSSGKLGKGSAVKTTLPKRASTTKEPPNVLDDILQAQRAEEQRKQQKYNQERLNFLRVIESRFRAYNAAKVKAKFLDLMRQAKSAELRRRLTEIERDHDRQVSRLDAMIQMYFKDFEEAEEQYRTCLRTHQINVDELLDLYEKRVQALEQQFRKNLTKAKLDHDQEIHYLKDVHIQQVREVKNIIEEMTKRKDEENEEMAKEFAIEMKFIANSYSNAFHVMKIEMNKEIRQKQQQYKEENENNGKPIAQAYQEYEILRNKNDELNEVLQQQNAQIRKNERLLAQWKAKWLNNLRESESRNADLKKEILQMKSYFVDVKNQMKRFRESERKKLANLVSMSRHCQKSLKQRLEFAERVLQHNNLNRKSETEVERLPLNAQEEEEMFGEDEQLDEQLYSTEDSTTKEAQLLNRYHKKYNKVVLDKAALEQEKTHLMEDNQKLREMLKAYLDGVSVNEEVLAKKNPLLIVEQLRSPPPGLANPQPT